MWQKAVLVVGAALTLCACASASPKELSQTATSHGFSVIPNSERHTPNTAYTSIGVNVDSCTGSLTVPYSGDAPYLTVYNKQGVAIIDGLYDATLAGVMGTPPAMTACKQEETSTSQMPPSQTTAR
jgi:hypothetical protein